MNKPATLTITDDSGEIVYMRFIDIEDMEGLIKNLDEFSDDFLRVITGDGEEYFSISEYTSKLLEDKEDK